jgi:hypothetical protein
MSPKEYSNLGLILASISVLGIIARVLTPSTWGFLVWGPIAGLSLSLVLIVFALAKGASLATQKRMDMVDVLNDCHAGIPRPDDGQGLPPLRSHRIWHNLS